MPLIQCPQLKKMVPADNKKSIMAHLLENKIQVASSCGGDGICGKCKMVIESKAPLPTKSDLEINTLQKNDGNPKERLSCQLYIDEDIEVHSTYW